MILLHAKLLIIRDMANPATNFFGLTWQVWQTLARVAVLIPLIFNLNRSRKVKSSA